VYAIVAMASVSSSMVNNSLTVDSCDKDFIQQSLLEVTFYTLMSLY